jgi:hypothetical protein
LTFSETRIEELLQAWPRLRRAPSLNKRVGVIQGWLAFTLKPTGLPEITDTYRLRLKVPLAGSLDLPVVYEEGGRIPRTDDNHVNPLGNLCLGSPWRIRIKCGSPPSLIDFVEQCVVPFLYAASWREQGNPGFPFDELAHGSEGLLADYERLLEVQGRLAVGHALYLLSLRRRVANKRRCPCRCGQRLGTCAYRHHLAALREQAPRSFYRFVGKDL